MTNEELAAKAAADAAAADAAKAAADKAAADGWYNDPDYRKVLPLRDEAYADLEIKKLVDKINHAIDKKQDKLKITPEKLLGLTTKK